MSETTPVTGSAEMADEPSMEDILASIRKIIADDEPVTEPTSPSPVVTEPSSEDKAPFNASEPLEPAIVDEVSTTPSSANLPADASFEDHMSAISASDAGETTTDFAAELDGLMAELDVPLELDNTPVIAQPVSSLTNTDVSGNSPSDELVDLDIEALLSEVDGTSEDLIPPATAENFTADSFDDDLDSLLDLEIPEMEEEAPIVKAAPSTPVKAMDEPLSSSEASDSIDEHDVMALLDSLGAELSETEASLKKPEQISEPASSNTSALDNSASDTFGSDDENLFDDLENLLTDNLEVEASLDQSVKQDTGSLDADSLDEGSLNEGGLNTALSETAEGDISDSDLNALLDDLILEADDDLMSELATPPFDSSSEQTEMVATPESLSLSEDDTDMSLVKSLMADLTEPEAEPASHIDVTETADAGNMFDNDGADDLETLISEPIEETSEGEIDISSLLEEDETTPSLDTVEMIEEDTENVLDDILNMTLDDEFEAHEGNLDALLEIPEADPEPAPEIKTELKDEMPTPESILADEVENRAAAETLNVEASKTAPIQISEEPSIFSDIARDAEQDADDVDALVEALENEELPVSAVDSIDAVLDDMAMGSIKAIEITQAEPEKAESGDNEPSQEETLSVEMSSETPPSDVNTITNEKSAKKKSPKETADMPKAALNTDAILDEVTEEASVNAFASLNSIVEENAIREERGDRIGDLVMEALRPMLKEWLDANLKGIVERAVTKEVKRISSGK